MKIYLPEKVKYIINKIYENNYEAYIVGGCVRDVLLGLEPNDYDITTSATPKVILDIFKDFKCIKTGIVHGTVSVIIDGDIYEITTYRIEGEYKDHRRPDVVDFTNKLEEDLKRRDFTINAMAYNEKVGLVDLFKGREDLNKKLITTVGNPYDRFNEDGLRMIRAIRFSSKLDFTIEKETLLAIYDNAKIIKNISLERITDEFSKIILSKNPENLINLFKTKLLEYLNMSKEDDERKLDKLYYNLKLLNKVEKDLLKRLVLLDYLIYEFDIKCESFYEKLIYSKKIKKDCNMILSSLKDIDMKNLDKFSIKIMLNKMGKNLFEEYLDIAKIIYGNDKNIKNIVDIYKEIEDNKECYTIKNLKINGNDILSLGYKNKEVGQMLNKILYEVIKNPKLNNKDQIIEKYTKSN